MDGVMTTMIDGINYNEDGDHPKNMIFVTKLNSSTSKSKPMLRRPKQIFETWKDLIKV